jgi:uncharacterized protein (TIGR02466 family)
MSTPQKLVFPLFSTPVYVNNVGDFPRPNLRALEFQTGPYNFLTTADKRLLHRADFKDVHDIVMKEVESYTREVLAVSKSIEFYITDSWINVHGRGHYAAPHTHNNSLVSGVLYLQVNEKSGDLVFQRDIHSLIPFPPALDLDMDTFNIYNCKSWSHKPKTNDVCLFPSSLMHAADPNKSEEERWCLAFNVFVRGYIGTLHKLDIR